MDITGRRREYIRKHVFVPDHGTPNAVMVAIASIIGDTAGIRAAWTIRATGPETGKTTYTCWVVTDTTLCHVSVEYARDQYDEEADRRDNLTPTSMESSARRLSGIIRLQLGAVYEDSSRDDTYYPAQPIKIKFTDGVEVTIPEEAAAVPLEQRSAVGGLLTWIRKGANF
jgi:hypothetical protein